jgi:hypothetical protein
MACGRLARTPERSQGALLAAGRPAWPLSGPQGQLIIVSGTKRSGTSMWMQILVASGLPFIGEKFPRDWGELFRDANPDGFYESELMTGVYWETNPHPRSGAYLFPEQTRGHAVKVFIPGLVRTDVAFIDRCIATMRPWRDYVRSSERLRQTLTSQPDVEATLPPALEWWLENYSLVRDIATRRYPAHVVSYTAVLSDPDKHVREVLDWVGAGDADQAVAAVATDGALPTSTESPPLPDGLEMRHVEIFDALYDVIERGQPVDDALVGAINRTHTELQPVFMARERALHEQALAPLVRR